MVPAINRGESAKYILVGPNAELHEVRVGYSKPEDLAPGDEVEAEDPAFGLRLYFVVRCIEHPEPDDPRHEEADTWVYLEMAR